MTDSRQLLAEYARNGSEAAFRELVTRYVDLVYSAAIRLVESDAHRAQDVAQTVFADLAHMAGSVSREAMLGGWLHRHTCFVAANLMRSERRRRARERQAAQMNVGQDNSEADRALIAPILDEAVNELGEADRMAILLRFFGQRDFRSVGEALGSNEDAARMRVNRALGKLHTLLKRRGVTTSAAALGAVLTVGAVESAPAGLAVAISSGVVVAGTTTATSTAIAATKTIAMTTLQKAIIGTALTAAIGTGIFEAHQAAQLRSQVHALQQQQTSLAKRVRQLLQQRGEAEKRLALLSTKPAPRLPAPSMHVTLQTNAPVENLQPTNLFARFKDKSPKLNTAQVEAYLKENGRTASSLLAAYRTSDDPALLKEAMQKYPNDPQVDFEAALDKNLSPEEQRQWLNALEKSAPDNALANYLSALNYFNSGQIDQGIQELNSAAGKGQFQDYTLVRWKNDQEAYLSAGYSAAEAAYLATWQLPLQQLAPVKQLGQDLVDLANAYSQSGDHTSAQAALQMAANLGQRYFPSSAGQVLLDQFVGLAIEKTALSAMNPDTPYGDNGQTVQDQLNQLTQQRAAYKNLVQQVDSLLPTMSDQDWVNYTDRLMMFGESAADQWLVNKYGQQ